MKYQLLSIGIELKNQNCINGTFFDAPAFCDFDVVIIDPLVLRDSWNKLIREGSLKTESDGKIWSYYGKDGGLGIKLESCMERRGDELNTFLNKTGGTLIIILRDHHSPIINLKKYRSSYTDPERTLNIYSWIRTVFPLIHRFLVPRNGFAVGDFNDGNIWGRFFRVFNSQVKYEVVLKDSFPSVDGFTKIAANKVGDTISFRLQHGKGNIIFLPPFETDNWDAFERILIDCIRGEFKQVSLGPPPEWIEKYKIPTEGKNKGEIGALEEQIEKLIIEKLELQREEDKLQNLKGLLYEQGKHGLEPLVREAFRILGFNKVLDPEDYKEPYDLYIEDEGISIIGEVGGSVRQIGIEKCRQLLGYEEERLTEGGKCKGILVGNGFLKRDPELREEQFSPEAIKGCERRNFCAVSSYDLYKMVADVIKNQNDKRLKETLRDELINCSGEYRYQKQLFEVH